MGMWQLLFVLFPVALTLSILVKLSVAHRRLQPSAFLELRELSFGVGCGLRARPGPGPGPVIKIGGVPDHVVYALTPKGREFIDHWLAAEPLE